MPVSTNPFEDGGGAYEEKKVNHAMAPHRNPFDDEDEDDDDDVTSSEDNAVTTALLSPTGLGSGDIGDNNNSGGGETFEVIMTSGSAAPDLAAAGASAEASWQYLGDLPYRRVPIYSQVQWNRTIESSSSSSPLDRTTILRHGLASFPAAAVQQHHHSGSLLLSAREVQQLLRTTTVTKVAGCPHGGPIAVVTLPVVTSSNQTGFAHAELRILTNAGTPLARLDVPSPAWNARLSQSLSSSSSSSSKPTPPPLYTPADILEMGFTSRATLIIVLKDSLCLTYDLQLQPILEPFFIMPRGEGEGSGGGYPLAASKVYEGGVAVLATNQNAAICELFDEHDDPDYIQTAHITTRKVSNAILQHHTGPSSTSSVDSLAAANAPLHYALITQLPTASFANANFCSFVTLAVLPRSRTATRHPEVFLSTNDRSVAVVTVATLEVTDVNCRARMASPIVDMCFAPNGRFLACFTESSMLTVISTSFETKVLDFDTSDGSAMPPLAMAWCGEDR